MSAPYRIAFLQTEALLSPKHDSLQRVVELLSWVWLFETTVKHPSLSVIDPDDTHVQLLDGQFVPMHALRVGEIEGTWFTESRRDEILWIELPLSPEQRRPVQLHTVRPGGVRESFAAMGQASLGEQCIEVLGLWLAARGLAPLASVTFSAEDLLGVAALLEPPLTAVGKKRPGWWTQEHPETDDERAPYETATAPANDDEPMPALPAALPATLKVAALRTFAITVGGDVHRDILAIEPGNPWALRDAFFTTLNQGRDYTLLRRCIAAAPGWGKPYLSLFVPESLEDETIADKPTDLEELAAFGFASVCLPENEYSTSGYAERLDDDARDDEALRFFERERDLNADYPGAWLSLLEALGEVERIGTWTRVAGQAANHVGLVVDGVVQPWNPDSMKVDLECSTALMNAGRLGEAIALRANRLEDLEASWPNHVGILKQWRKEPRFVAWCYAREGFFRGDDGRVLEGFSRAEPDDGVDLAMLLETLLACDRKEAAVLAWAHYGVGMGYATPSARVAAARVFFAVGRFADGLEQLLRVHKGDPMRGLHAATDRLGRMLALAPLADMETIVEAALTRGALTLARWYARDLADFVPGAERSRVINKALGARTPQAFDPGWLAPLSAPRLGGVPPCQSAIDTLFAEASDNTLACADRLIERAAEVVFSDATAQTPERLARATLALFTQALGRYLCAASGAPSVLAGALRTVASEALLALGGLAHELSVDDLRALLGAIDRPVGAAPVEIADAWLLRIESALRLEERVHGRLHELEKGLTHVPALLRGPERAAIEAFTATQLARVTTDKAAADRASLLFERMLRLGGGAGLSEWVQAGIAAGLPEPELLDRALAAVWLGEGFNAEPSVIAARILFTRGDGEGAYEVLCRGLSAAGEEWRDAQIEALQPLWKAAKLSVPFSFKKGAAQVFEALQKGDPATAERVGRWLVAFDPENGEAHRNLGLAYAMQGKTEQALPHLVEATEDQATQILSGVLHQAGRTQEAMAVLDYASRWYVRAEQWLTFGGIAYAAMDNPRTVQAYRNAYELDKDAFDASMLNGYAGVLDEVGEWQTCEKISAHLLRVAGNDPVWVSNGHLQMACALIGLGRFDEAREHAQKAVELNPMPENADICAKTLARAKAKEKPTLPPALAPVLARDPIFELLEASEVQAIDAQAAAGSWPRERVKLRAARFRYRSENHVPVTSRGKDAALSVVARTNGSTDMEATLCRVFALDLREQALFPYDPPPPLGDRQTREAFYEEFRARGGIILGTPAPAEPAFEDRIVFAGARIASISEYVRLLTALAGSPPRVALAELGLHAADYREVCVRWAAAMASDVALGLMVEVGLGQPR